MDENAVPAKTADGVLEITGVVEKEGRSPKEMKPSAVPDPPAASSDGSSSVVRKFPPGTAALLSNISNTWDSNERSSIASAVTPF